jgi:light-regulated signal transduction histidine kinase (bacteriophytochrome)
MGLRVSSAIRDVTRRRQDEQALTALNNDLRAKTRQLEVAYKELEAFSYSVSHDLRTPLRSLDGFSQALLEDYSDRLDDEGRNYLQRIRAASQRMGQLIDDLLNLSKVTRATMERERVDLSKMAREIFEMLHTSDPQRRVDFIIADGLLVEADSRLLRIVMVNLLGNAWKFTAKAAHPRIEFGCEGENGDQSYFVRDNGAGFDMKYAGKLFGAFQRLHPAAEFPGTGIGLATVQRIVQRHAGRIWATGEPNAGATFHFTLRDAPSELKAA